jgi:hypothetical protein
MPGQSPCSPRSRLARLALAGLGTLTLLAACGLGTSAAGTGRPAGDVIRAPVFVAGLFADANIGKHQLTVAVLLRSRESGPVIVDPPTWRGSTQLQVVAAGVMPGRLAPDAARAPRLARLSRRETTPSRGSSAAVLVFHLDCVAQRLPVTGSIYLHVRIRGENLTLRAPRTAASGDVPWTQALPPEICP